MLAVLFSLTAPLMANSAQPSGERAESPCGQVEKLGRTFSLQVNGKKPSCRRAREIVAAPCKIRTKAKWSCFSQRAPGPFIIWFLSDELFERNLSRVITYERYPCSEAIVNADLFSTDPRGFPTLRQLLADDVIRCDLVADNTFNDVKDLLGPADERTSRKYLYYQLGPTRDSVLPIDSEVLSIRFSKSGLVTDVGIFQT